MTDVEPGTLLRRPPEDARARSRMGRFLDRMEAEHGIELPTYQDAWAWSVDAPGDFWAGIVDEFGIRLTGSPGPVLADPGMPGAVWYPGATLNYAEHALRRRDDLPAVIAHSQTRGPVELTFAELADQGAAVAAGLRALGIGRGDRVVAYLPNIPETLVAFLACASIGAVWSSCAPEFGTRAVVDRVQQIDPALLLVVDGYRYGAKAVDRRREVAEIREALPTLRATVVVGYLDPDGAREAVPDAVSFEELLATDGELDFDRVPFDHPLYILYSSGTTGLPKAIVHGHGGILLEHAKMLGLHHDLGPGERFTWFTTTGWMMWNVLVSGLLVESTIVLFDGDPGHPDLLTLWRLADETDLAMLGVSAPFLMSCRKARLSPGRELDLSSLRTIGSTGAPLPPEGFGWVYEHVHGDLVLSSSSGGTDVCTAFVTASPLLEVRAGETPGRCLGARVEAFDPEGRPVIGRRGELVITAPMPSMPVGFWDDPGRVREREAYFEHFPGVWRHGDWIEITERGSCIITGRSDATLNRGGVRMGTSEFYSVVEGFDEVADSLVVHLDDPESAAGRLVLFVQPAEGVRLDDELLGRLRQGIRGQLSPRHVPDEIHRVPAVPRTISGKKMEVPVKRLLEGEPLERVANPGAMADPAAIEPYVALASASDAPAGDPA